MELTISTIVTSAAVIILSCAVFVYAITLSLRNIAQMKESTLHADYMKNNKIDAGEY